MEDTKIIVSTQINNYDTIQKDTNIDNMMQIEEPDKIQRDTNIGNMMQMEEIDRIQRDTNIDNSNNINLFVTVYEKTRLMQACEKKNHKLINKIITNEKHTINYVFVEDEIVSVSKQTRNKSDFGTIGKTNNLNDGDVCCCWFPILPFLIIHIFNFQKLAKNNVLTALSIACSLNDINTMKLLIKNGADVNDMSIFHSVSNNNMHSLKLLIKYGANINKIIVLDRKYDGFLRSLHNVNIENTLFEHACECGDSSIINFLIESGIDVVNKFKCLDIIVQRGINNVYQQINNMTEYNNNVKYSSLNIVTNCIVTLLDTGGP